MTRSPEGVGPEHVPADKDNAPGDLLMAPQQMLDLAQKAAELLVERIDGLSEEKALCKTGTHKICVARGGGDFARDGWQMCLLSVAGYRTRSEEMSSRPRAGGHSCRHEPVQAVAAAAYPPPASPRSRPHCRYASSS